MRRIKLHISLLVMLLICFSCKNDDDAKAVPDDILIQVGDSVLTRNMVTSSIPPGLSASDSLKMFDALVEAWVERNMLLQLAGSKLPDIEKIERLVELYREQLLANEYRRIMASDNVNGVSLESIQQYYESHPEQFCLKNPLIKGIYLKVSADSSRIRDLRKWLDSAGDEDIDSLENYGLKGAMEYDYFSDIWIDWQAVADRIPYRFNDADKFVSDTKLFEWEDNGSVYMLRITGFMKSGEMKPLPFAESEIRDRLLEDRRGDYDRKLLESLYMDGKKENRIKPGAYTPCKYRNI